MTNKPPLPPALLARARELRQSGTDAERLVWQLVRNRQLDGWKFRRQHPIGRYILDFYCYEARLGIELDGGQHAEPDQANTTPSVLARWKQKEFECCVFGTMTC